MPTSIPDQPAAAPSTVRPPAPTRFVPATARGRLPVATCGPLATAILTDLPQPLSVHWH
ncbi:hypothetical protein [Streptacidiphilus albus]|uniref:hypothetical protein n=1 Tax=Streptacidiphilus albus TaxID=105425 RepID=UPI000B1DD329|nr:hypothetical protein [Streptacidiphilus albus]